MKRVMSMLAIAGLCSLGAVVSAQTPPATTATKPAKAEKAAKMPAPTYTGCVAEGTKKGTFELKDATATGSTDKMTYDLHGKGLAAHVNHKVEVTGKVSKPASGNEVLTAKSVKMVADKCS
jgi:hypothetical protein